MQTLHRRDYYLTSGTLEKLHNTLHMAVVHMESQHLVGFQVQRQLRLNSNNLSL